MGSPRRPPALGQGSVVHLVAPSGPFPRARFEAGRAALEARGYEVRFDPGVFETRRYLAGDDGRRLAELQGALDDPDAGAVWAIRGGYGAMRLLPDLDLAGVVRRPKVVVGFSDVTALHARLNQAGLATVHGPVACQLAELPSESLDHLWRLLERPAPPGPLVFEGTPVRAGRAEGRLLGGNLAVLTRLLGTPYLPDLEGAVLFLEDVGERPYRLDRMLTHLELAGIPPRLAGVLVGDLTGCEEPEADYTAAEVVADRLAGWGVPAALGFPAGHGARNLPLPLGLEVTLDAGEGRLDWAEGAVVPRRPAA